MVTDLLGLEDSDIIISDIIAEGQTKTLIIKTPPVAQPVDLAGFPLQMPFPLMKYIWTWTMTVNMHWSFRISISKTLLICSGAGEYL